MGIFDFFSKKNKTSEIKAITPVYNPGFDGSKFSGAMPYEVFANQDENLNIAQLRAKSKKQFAQNTIAHTAIETKVNTVVNAGLNLEAKPNKRILNSYGINVDPDWDKSTEARFDLWASSDGADYNYRNNFYQMENEAFREYLLTGESIVIPRYIPDPNRGRIGRLNIQLVKSEQLITPIDKILENVVNGKKLDNTGTVVGYYFTDKSKNPLQQMTEPVYIPRWAEKTGRLNVINPIRSTSVGAINGTPDLTPILHDLDGIEKYRVSELQAAVVNATIALIQNSDGQNPNPNMLASGIQKRTVTTTNSDNTKTESLQVSAPMPGMHLYASHVGQSLQSYDTKRPNVNFAAFVESVSQHIAASMGIPIEILFKKFGSNYSASRAALLEYWRYVIAERKNWAWNFCQPIYELWLADEIAFGRIIADGWNNSDLQLKNIIRKSWSCAEWHGIAKGNIDPLKELNAAALAEDRGYTTAERNSRELFGMNFDTNYERRITEVEMQRQISVGKPSDYLITEEKE